jgi:hypothetical protein
VKLDGAGLSQEHHVHRDVAGRDGRTVRLEVSVDLREREKDASGGEGHRHGARHARGGYISPSEIAQIHAQTPVGVRDRLDVELARHADGTAVTRPVIVSRDAARRRLAGGAASEAEHERDEDCRPPRADGRA